MHRRALATYASATTESDDLIQRYGTLIDRVARRIVLRIGLHSAFDDLWSAGALGLLEASGRFDAARGVSFETFVEHRIRGAMLDELRRMDHLPRRLRSRADDLQKAKHKLSTRLGREASTDEVAAELNIDLDEVSGIEALSEPHVSLETVAQAAASDEAGIEDRLARAQAAKALAASFQGLPERLQTVLGLHYLEGLTYREIAKMMDISEPRVCQLHADGLKKLRGSLGNLGEGVP
jgi:RNA polymerase sigma factor for flagellar operon FliA